MGLILPESIALESRRSQALEALEHTRDECRYWDPKLRDIDARLSLRRAWPNAEGPGIFAGMWHIIRDGSPDGTVSTAWVISTNGLGTPGPYREMSHDILEELKRGDLWSPSAVREAESRRRRVEASKERATENHREARRDDLALNVKAMINPGMSLSARASRAKSRKK